LFFHCLPRLSTTPAFAPAARHQRAPLPETNFFLTTHRTMRGSGRLNDERSSYTEDPHGALRKPRPPATGRNAPEPCLLCGPVGLSRRRREGRPYQPPLLTLPTPAPQHSSPFPINFVSIAEVPSHT
jgi:hypothetical protein